MSTEERVLSDWAASAEKEGRSLKSRFDHSRRTRLVNKLTMTQSAMAIIALIISSVVAGFMIADELNDQRELTTERALVDAKIAAGVAKAEATAQAAKEHARIGLAEVQRANAQLEARGLISSAQH